MLFEYHKGRKQFFLNMLTIFAGALLVKPCRKGLFFGVSVLRLSEGSLLVFGRTVVAAGLFEGDAISRISVG